MDKKVEQYDQRIARLQREIQVARKQKKARLRTIDTRRKVLSGALLLNLLERGTFGEDFERVVVQELDRYLTKDNDRILFPDLLPDIAHDEDISEVVKSKNSRGNDERNSDDRSEDFALTKQSIQASVANDKSTENSKKNTATSKKRRLKSGGSQDDIIDEFDV